MVGIAHDAAAGEIVAKERAWMFLERQAGRPVVLDHLFAKAHGRQYHLRLGEQRIVEMSGKQRQRMDIAGRRLFLGGRDRKAAITPGSPQRLAPLKPERAE